MSCFVDVLMFVKMEYKNFYKPNKEAAMWIFSGDMILLLFPFSRGK